jgi:LysR family hydrogen peroxide-inducible transcriptional activator
MINFTMKHFRYFDALARERHFGRAAEACNVSQPALSVQIKELEALLGAPLVERTARQVHLTTFGEEFLLRARRVLHEVEEMSQLQRSVEGPLMGNLRMGIIPTVAPYLLPNVVRTLMQRLPGVSLLPHEMVTQSLATELLESRLDFIIAALPISEPSLKEFTLFEEDFVLVRHESEAQLPVPPADQMHKMKLLLLQEGHCFRDQALAFCATRPSANSVVMEGSSLTTLVQMVSAGLGITLIPEMAVPLERKYANLSVSRFDGKVPKRSIGMAWRKTSPLDNQLMELGAIIRQAGQEQISKGRAAV